MAVSKFKITDLNISVPDSTTGPADDVIISGQKAVGSDGNSGGNVIIKGGETESGEQGGYVILRTPILDWDASSNLVVQDFDTTIGGGIISIKSPSPGGIINFYNDSNYLEIKFDNKRTLQLSTRTNLQQITVPMFIEQPFIDPNSLSGTYNLFAFPYAAGYYLFYASSPTVINSIDQMADGKNIDNYARFRVRNMSNNSVTLTHMYSSAQNYQKIWCIGGTDIVLAQYEAVEIEKLVYSFQGSSVTFNFLATKL